MEMEHLEILYLSSLQLTHIPEAFMNLVNLKELWLGKNKLDSLPTNFGQLSRLEKLGEENEIQY